MGCLGRRCMRTAAGSADQRPVRLASKLAMSLSLAGDEGRDAMLHEVLYRRALIHLALAVSLAGLAPASLLPVEFAAISAGRARITSDRAERVGTLPARPQRAARDSGRVDVPRKSAPGFAAVVSRVAIAFIPDASSAPRDSTFALVLSRENGTARPRGPPSLI